MKEKFVEGGGAFPNVTLLVVTRTAPLTNIVACET